MCRALVKSVRVFCEIDVAFYILYLKPYVIFLYLIIFRLYFAPFVINTLYFLFYTVLSLIYISYSILYNPYFILLIAFFILQTLYFILHSLGPIVYTAVASGVPRSRSRHTKLAAFQRSAIRHVLPTHCFGPEGRVETPKNGYLQARWL